jgi:phosphoglycerol transferase
MKLSQSFWKRAGLVVPLAALAAIWVMTRVGSVLPKILGDELTYSMDARKLALADSAVPNYLFNIVFKSTNLCGYEFYGCAKGLNLMFLMGLGVVVYLAARMFARPSLSLFVALLTVVGPISSYVSYFTPDLMFFFSAAIVVLFVVRQTGESTVLSWALIGLGVGVSALVKPHALFLLIPIAAFIIYLKLRKKPANLLSAFLQIAAVVGSTFAIKWAVGYLAAGPKGLGLFGVGYDASAAVASGASGSAVAAASDSSQWFGQGILQLLFHLAFLLIFFAGPIVAIFLKRDPASKAKSQDGTYERFRFFVIAATLTLVTVSSVFVVISSSWGETLDSRVMVRYYEYILVFLPLLLLPVLNEWRAADAKTKWIVPLAALAIWGIALPIMTQVVPPLFTDSSLIASALKSGLTLYTFAALSLAAVVYMLANPEKGAGLWLFGVAPLFVLVFAISSYVNMTVPSSVVGMYTHSSRWVHDNLNDEQKHGLAVFGNVLQNVQAARLWIDDPSTTGQALPPGSQVDIGKLPNGSYALLIGQLSATGTGRLVHREQNFVVVQIQR